MAPEILVRGEGEASAVPDRAALRVTVEGEGSSQETAYAQAAKPAREIDAVLDRYANAIGKRTATALTVLPKTRWRKGESIRTGYWASRVTVLEVTDLARLSELIADLAAAGPAAIDGPVWQLAPDNDAHRAARQQAIAEGQARASTYAESLGLTIKRIAWVAEPGLRFGHDGYAPVARPMAAAPMRGHLAEEPIEVTADEIRVRAIVEMGFEMAQGEEA
jgi:uncharacterized protein YggE